MDLREDDFFPELFEECPFDVLRCEPEELPRDFEELLREERRCEPEELLFFALLFLPEDFLRGEGGTFAPSRRASDRPIAIACLGLVTFLPLRPLLSLPRFISCISSRTFSCAFGPYFLPPEDLLELFFVAIQNSPFCCIGKRSGMSRLRDEIRANESCTRTGNLSSDSGREDVFHIDPLRRIIAGVARDAIAIAFAAVA